MALIQVSISGGRTSAYMAHLLLEKREAVADWLGEEEIEYLFIFANTGMEHPDTLRFMRDFSRETGVPVVWVEGVVFHGRRKSTGHRLVTFESAFRPEQWEDLEHPFHNHIRKYGIPNVKWKGCTREMKLRAIDSYMRSIGRPVGSYYTAIGIRADERRRVSSSKEAEARKIIYPLIDFEPSDKEDVLDYWSSFSWDLQIPEWLGNCIACYKKSDKKLLLASREVPLAFRFTKAMEARYPRVGAEFLKDPQAKDRVFFRMNRSTDALLHGFEGVQSDRARSLVVLHDAGCSESCEMFETEES